MFSNVTEIVSSVASAAAQHVPETAGALQALVYATAVGILMSGANLLRGESRQGSEGSRG
jgi:predicted nucleic acid-binding Zn ribbon protein